MSKFRTMDHNNEPRALGYHRAFGIGIGLNVGFVIFEAVSGILSDSLARIQAECYDRFGIGHVTLLFVECYLF